MCTLAVSFREVEGLPLLVAANRDEALDRPSSGPALRPGPLPHVAPRDERAGGTWLGVNARGVFAAITNRFLGPADTGRRSRGVLVPEVLFHETALDAHRALASLDPLDFNGFHLLYADADRAFLTWSDGRRLQQRELSPGLHVLSERSLGAADDALRTARATQAFRAAAVTSAAELERLREVVTLHDPETRIGGTCVHVPERNYGTRSSMLLGLGPDQRRLLWAEGKPCEVPFVERSELLAALDG